MLAAATAEGAAGAEAAQVEEDRNRAARLLRWLGWPPFAGGPLVVAGCAGAPP